MKSREWLRKLKKNKEADAKKRDSTEAKNEAESLCYETEKQLDEFKDKLKPEDAEGIQQEIQKLRDLVAAGDTKAIRSGSNHLRQQVIKRFEGIYKQQEQQQTQQPGGQQPVDAEVVDEEEKKKN